MNAKCVKHFIVESNRIEGIVRPPTDSEFTEHFRFMSLEEVTVDELVRFVSVYQPGALLRDKPGLDVLVGRYRPPPGGPEICRQLHDLLQQCQTLGPYLTHVRYELIHPFTDCNGRSGRMLWAWLRRDYPLGFLHHFYYEALQHATRLVLESSSSS